MDFGIFRPGLLRSTARETGAFSGTMRLACPEEPRIALHVVQRALAACFSGARARLAYLEGLRECAARGGCAVHAYALMGNHVHLLVTPARQGGATRSEEHM